jgi:16S rRNA processing protein RimM
LVTVQPAEVRVGEITGVFGVKGELKLRSHTVPPLAVGRYLPWQLRHRGAEQSVERPKLRAHGKGLLLTLDGVADRTAAEALIGAEIWVPRSALPVPAAGEFYWIDLEGLDVFTVDGTALGKVSHLFSTGSNDVIVARGERERLIPFVRPDVVREIDLSAGRITVDWDPEF